MKYKPILIALGGLLLAAATAPVVQAQAFPPPPSAINWNAPQPITGDTDVDTKGTLDRAYLFSVPGQSSVINGVTFTTFGNHVSDTETFQSYAVTAFGSANAPYANISSAYKAILGNGYYNFNNTVAPGAITLNGLTPGATYEVEVWVNDSRALTRSETVSGSPPLHYDVPNTNGGLGQYIIGTFVANTAGSQTLTFTPDSNSVSQVNGLQLRLLSAPLPAATVLTGAFEFGSDTSGNGTREAYSTIGSGYYLYVKQGNTFLNASNGTINIPLALGTNTFELRGDGTGASELAYYGLNLFFGGNTATPSISVFGPEGTPLNPTPPFAPDNAPHTYGGATGQGAGTTSAVIGNYQITLTDYYWQSPSVQQINEVGEYNIAPNAGSDDFTGHFVLTVTPYTPSVITWNAPQQITGDSDVPTSGTIDRAYRFSETGAAPILINGVPFSEFLGQTTDTTTFEANVTNALGSPAPPYGATSPAYKSILASADYNFGTTPATIMLNHLTPGAMYQVEVWVNDSRGLNRSESVSGSPLVEYNTLGGASGGLGQYIIGTFTANSAGSQPLTFLPSATSVAEINGLQLRVLSPVLTGAVEFSTDNLGNGTSEAYSTIGGGYYLYVKQGSAFLNASNGSISVPLALGDNTFELRGDGTGAADLGMYGLNLFFGGSRAAASISVFGPEGTPLNPTPPYAANNAPNTYGGSNPQGAGTTTFLSGNYRITLTDYYWQSPAVQSINEVGEYNIGPSGSNDFTGHFVLNVAPLNPTITAVSPGVIPAGSPSMTLTITGLGFAPGATILFNGAIVPTTLVSSTQLLATIPGSALLKPGVATVSVVGPNGVIASTVTVTIAAPALQTAFTLARDPVSQQVIVTVTVSNSGGGYANNVVLTNAAIGAAFPPLFPPLPFSLGTINPGGSVTAVFTYPPAVPAGRNTLTLQGASASGNFGGTYRITVP